MIFYIILIFLLIVCIIKSSESYNSHYLYDTKININKLIRQTARWATAAEQDTNPYIANLHATYSLGYLMALREIYNDDIINKLGNINVKRLEEEVTKIMDGAISQLIQVCPEGQPKNKFLAFLAKQ
jgi:hypothetical protein